ncbi:hypothetical protein [uncultured Alistipes sp.]|uniref:hypothetical protein n=1 Tax=uncultured Alistipes sp. TaxID=538949 RepID=UPI00265E1176|nr:hypothetical protein [uncultured Alistipes sp.]
MTRIPSGNGTEQPASAEKQNPRREDEEPERLIVRITRYQPFIDIVSDSRKIVNAALLITLVTCLVFMGLLAIVLTVKRIYPYNDIQTNALGAMTIKDEDKEVTYWLFNTAELWADSGIAVKKGDILTIRASGLSHSAIHHLKEDTENNRRLRDPWSDTEGFQASALRDPLRAKWRIIPQQKQDALLMQVIPGSIANSGMIDWRYLTASYLAQDGSHLSNDLYLIGKERTELYINRDGMLHFAVNDIVLTPDIIYEMVLDNLHHIGEGDPRVEQFIRRFRAEHPTSMPWTFDKSRERNFRLFEALGREQELCARYNLHNESCYKFGPYPGNDVQEAQNTLFRNEMSYYNEQRYYNAWYDDNVGSFLIVVERKK